MKTSIFFLILLRRFLRNFEDFQMFRDFQRDFPFHRFEDKDSPRFRHFLLEFPRHLREFSKRNIEKPEDSRFSFDKLRFW